MPMRRQPTVKTAVITFATDDDLSAEVDLAGYGLIGLIIPTIDSGNVTFEVSATTGGTFVTLKDAVSATLTITAVTGNFAVSADELAALSAYRYVKVKTSVAQTANRTFTFVLKG